MFYLFVQSYQLYKTCTWFIAFEYICKTPTENWNRCKNIKSCKHRMITENSHEYFHEKKKKRISFTTKATSHNMQKIIITQDSRFCNEADQLLSR